MAVRPLIELKHFIITVDDEQKLLRVKRTASAYDTMEELRETNHVRAKALTPYVGKGYAMVLDARDGPLRNDPAFEAETRESRVQMMTLFTRTAIIVKSAVGVLQLQRLNRDADLAARVRVFHDDEASALAFALGH